MAEDTKPTELLERAMAATSRRCTVPLNEFSMLPERYCHRPEEELSPEKLELFLDSLVLEGGVRVPVVFFTDAQKNKVLISGHRRIQGCKILVERNEPHFTAEMSIEAIEMLGASPLDLLVHSVSDNENRQNLSPVSRLQTVKKLHDAGVEVKRAARALGVSDSTYSRDLKLVKQAWLYQHVQDHCITTNHATKLLNEAEKVNRVKELREDLDAWIAEKKKENKEKERRLKAEGSKEQKPAEVKNQIKELVEHWVSLIKEKRPFDGEAEWDFVASISEDGKLQIGSLNLKLSEAKAENVMKVLAKMSQLTKRLTPIAQERLQIERQREQVKTPTAPYDFELLRQIDPDMAKKMEEKYRLKLQKAPDGEEDVGSSKVEERTETDLASTIELPGPDAKPVSAVAQSQVPSPLPSGQPNPAAETTEPIATVAKPKGKNTK